MQTIDFVMLGVYLATVLVAGLAMARTGANTRSFFGAGGQAPWWISGLSLYMSFFSAGTFVVWGAIAYELGWVAVTIQWTMCLAGFVTALFIAPRWRRTGALTAAEFIGKRLGTGLQQFYSYIVMIYGVFATGAVLYPVAKMISVATPFSLQACILVIGSVVVLYTTVGGLWAVLITDTLQFVILMVAVFVVVPLSLARIGGLNALVTETPAGFFDLFSGEFTAAFIAAYVLYSIFYLAGNWGFIQKYTSVANERSARKVGLLYAALYVVSPMLWMLPPMAYRVMNPNLTGLEAEGAYILVSEAVLPVGILGILFSAMISATASTAQTTLNITSAVFTHDVYKNLIHPSASERLQMVVARVSTVVIGGVVIGIALLVPRMGGIVNLVITMGALAGGPIMAPPIWALFSRYLTSRGALTATVLGLAINLGFKSVSPVFFGLSLSRGVEMAVGVGVPVLILLAFEGWNRQRGVTDPRFAAAVHPASPTLEEEADAVQGLGQSAYSLRVLSAALAFLGLSIAALSLFTPEGRALPLVMGLVVLLPALGLRRLGRRAVAVPPPAETVSR